MDGDPADVKRPRLDHEPPAYPLSAGPSRPLQPSPHYPEPHHSHQSGTSSAPPAVHPTSLPPPHGAQQSPPGSAYQTALPDPRNPAAYQPSPSTLPGPADARPGYGPLNTQPARSFSVDSGTPRLSTAIHPVEPEPQLGAPPPSAHDPNQPHMEHGAHASVYATMDPHVNGGGPNGLPYHPQPEQYPVNPVGAHHSYPPTPVTAYPQASPFTPGPSSYGFARRKQVRAQQACNNCRQRKQKCDESRPCGYCKNEGLDCEYREVPPPKTDRTMQEILRKLDDVQKEVSSMSQYVYRGATFHRGEPMSALPAMKMEASGDMSGLISPGRPPLSSQTPSQQSVPQYANQAPANPAVAGRIEEPALQSHYTGAHHLMNRWPTIRPWFVAVGITDENYVYKVEQKRGPLNLYSWVANRDEASLQETGVTSPAGESITAPSPPEAAWGTRMLSSASRSDAGGTNSDGSLRLDAETIRRCHDSYMANMWIIHPFIDPQALRNMVDKFIATYSPSSRSPRFATPAVASRDPYSSVPSKRKRQSAPADDTSSPGSPRLPTGSSGRKQEFESTIDNALVLLVLALGNILEHDEFLMEEPAAGYRSQSASHGFVKPSPPQTQSSMTFSSAPSPGFDPSRSTAGSRGSSVDKSGYGEWKETQRRKQFTHTERCPGIAYFAQATDIMGNHYTGNDIKHAQAFLLAGLYYGQLSRVFESWRWIHAGCCVIDMLLKFKYNEEINKSRQEARAMGSYDDLGLDTVPQDPIFDDKVQIVTTLFWSAVQLDSDIRAELDSLPSNAMAGYADRIPFPQLLVNVKRATYDTSTGPREAQFIDLYNRVLDVSKVHKYYLHQLTMRRLLNRAHLALYEEETKQDKTGRKPFTWADADPQMLWTMLQDLRSNVPPDIAWSDNEHPSQDINAARLRGKYYGAAYIISRPFLRTALYDMEPFEYDISRFENSPGDHDAAEESDGVETLPKLRGAASPNQSDKVLLACKKCIEAVMKSTTAFDGLGPPGDLGLTRRPRVTNIYGTAAAQFSNICVLAATYTSWLHQFVPEQEFFDLLHRTIGFLHRLSPLSPIFNLHARVLEVAAEQCEAFKAMQLAQNTPQAYGTPLPPARTSRVGSMAGSADPVSAHSSFSSNR